MKKLQSNVSILPEDSGKEKLQDSSTNITKEVKKEIEKIIIPKEIERKFLVDKLPENLDKYSHKKIIQWYVAITEDGTEVRLRKKWQKFFQTIKSSWNKIRDEFEIELTKDQFEALWDSTAGKRVEKTRYEIPYEYETTGKEWQKIKVTKKIELDIYYGNLDWMLSAEVEFKTEEESNKFVTPEWFGKEVTDDKKYKNKNLAISGKPEWK